MTIGRPTRRTSKLMTYSSVAGLFGTSWLAIWQGQESVAQTALTMIPVVLGAYMGIGHADFRLTRRHVADKEVRL